MIALIIVVLAFGYLPAYLAEVSLLECMYKYQENLDYRYRACNVCVCLSKVVGLMTKVDVPGCEGRYRRERLELS